MIIQHRFTVNRKNPFEKRFKMDSFESPYSTRLLSLALASLLIYIYKQPV